METYILHIREEAINVTSNNYEAWCTEKQALKSASEYILDERGVRHALYDQNSLAEAANSLVESNKIKEAIALINEYSRPYLHPNGAQSYKITITICKSKFLGSPFE